MLLLRFLIVGVANTLIGLSIIYFAMYFLNLNILRANIIGYSVGILLGFLLNKIWTFGNNGFIISTFIRYLVVLALAYSANLVTVLFTSTHFLLNPYIVQALGIIPYTAIGFLGSRYFVFTSQENTKQETEVKNGISPLMESPFTSRPIDIAIVVPCYNEEAVLLETTSRFSSLLEHLTNKGKISSSSRVYYVDDGSTDGTWKLIESLAQNHEFVRGIKLSRNRGHQNALLAGLLHAQGEAIVSVDADLQDDLYAIEKMIDFYAARYDIVYGVRDCRKTDTFFKRFTAIAYYRLLHLMGVEIVYNHADYRLMSRKVIEALREFGEVNLFLRGIIPQLGFSCAIVYYDRTERFAGTSKYPLKKMLSFAWQGITSFSDLPLRLITTLGLLVSLGSFLITIWVIGVRLFTNYAIPGWASTVLPIYFLGGIQLLCLGIMGEYLAKIYSETKRRPRFIIEKSI